MFVCDFILFRFHYFQAKSFIQFVEWYMYQFHRIIFIYICNSFRACRNIHIIHVSMCINIIYALRKTSQRNEKMKKFFFFILLFLLICIFDCYCCFIIISSFYFLFRHLCFMCVCVCVMKCVFFVFNLVFCPHIWLIRYTYVIFLFMCGKKICVSVDVCSFSSFVIFSCGYGY